MDHERALELVSMICPKHIGRLWNTTQRNGCDTVWAVADQYDDDEFDEAAYDLFRLSEGIIPDGWEPA